METASEDPQRKGPVLRDGIGKSFVPSLSSASTSIYRARSIAAVAWWLSGIGVHPKGNKEMTFR
jgi:hypothetical protein